MAKGETLSYNSLISPPAPRLSTLLMVVSVYISFIYFGENAAAITSVGRLLQDPRGDGKDLLCSLQFIFSIFFFFSFFFAKFAIAFFPLFRSFDPILTEIVLTIYEKGISSVKADQGSEWN